MNKKVLIFKLVPILIFVFQINLFSQINHNYIDSILKSENTDNKSRYQSFKNIHSFIVSLDSNVIDEQFKNLIQLTQVYNKKDYIYSLMIYSSHLLGKKDFYKSKQFIDNALFESKIEKLNYEIAESYYLESQYFYKTNLYDSVYAFCMQSVNLFNKLNEIDKVVSIYQMLGDMYYSIEFYNEAEIYYNKVIDLKGDIEYYYKFREYVIINNLALIKYYNDDLIGSLNIFKKNKENLQKLIQKEPLPAYFARNAYSDLKICELYLKLDSFDLASKYYYTANDYLEKNPGQLRYSGYNTIDAIFMKKLGKLDSALIFLKKAELIQNEANDLTNLSITYFMSSEIYKIKKNFELSREYLEKSMTTIEKRKKKINVAKFVQLKAETEFQKQQDLLESKDYNIKVLTLFLVVAVLLISIIVIYYLKQFKSSKLLVKKNIEIAHNEIELSKIVKEVEVNTQEIEIEVPPELLDNNNLISDDIIDDKNYDQYFHNLAQKIDKLVKEEKLYLNPEFSVNSLCDLFNTNRSYISRAVNKNLSENFKTYINDLRIKEAVRLLSDENFDMYKIETIYELAGFKNRASFNRAFLKYTGVTPSFFHNSRLHNDLNNQENS